MNGTHPDPQEVERFILEQIETVSHLEALCLLWNSRPRSWSLDEISARLYVTSEITRDLVEDLVDRRLVESLPSMLFGYRSGDADQDRLVEGVEATYRREIVRVSNIIHAKGSPAIRAFARAFRIRRERE